MFLLSDSLFKIKSVLGVKSFHDFHIFQYYCESKNQSRNVRVFIFLLDTYLHQSLYTTSGFADFLKRWFYLWIFFSIFFCINLKTHQCPRCFSFRKRISSATWTKKLPAGSLFIRVFSFDNGNGFLHFGR